MSTILNNVQVGLTKILKQLKEAVLLFFKSKDFLFYYYIVTIINKNMGVENGSGSVLCLYVTRSTIKNMEAAVHGLTCRQFVKPLKNLVTKFPTH